LASMRSITLYYRTLRGALKKYSVVLKWEVERNKGL